MTRAFSARQEIAQQRATATSSRVRWAFRRLFTLKSHTLSPAEVREKDEGIAWMEGGRQVAVSQSVSYIRVSLWKRVCVGVEKGGKESTCRAILRPEGCEQGREERSAETEKGGGKEGEGA
eukprot:3580633-Rhodomonas_salina.2